VAMKPAPKCCCQIRFTRTRAVTGVFWVGDGHGQLEAAAALVPFGAVFRIGRKDFEETAGDDRALVRGFAAVQHGVIARAGHIGDGIGAGRRAGMVGLKITDLALEALLGALEFALLLAVTGAAFAERQGLGFMRSVLFLEFLGLREVVEEIRGLRNLGEEGRLLAGELRFGDVGEHAVKRVIVLGGDRVEFMIVAAGAGNGEAEERLGGDVDTVVDDVVDVAVELVAEGEKPEGGEGALVGGGLSVRIWLWLFCANKKKKKN